MLVIHRPLASPSHSLASFLTPSINPPLTLSPQSNTKCISSQSSHSSSPPSSPPPPETASPPRPLPLFQRYAQSRPQAVSRHAATAQRPPAASRCTSITLPSSFVGRPGISRIVLCKFLPKAENERGGC